MSSSKSLRLIIACGFVIPCSAFAVPDAGTLLQEEQQRQVREGEREISQGARRTPHHSPLWRSPTQPGAHPLAVLPTSA